jgi:hypothetical protein
LRIYGFRGVWGLGFRVKGVKRLALLVGGLGMRV